MFSRKFSALLLLVLLAGVLTGAAVTMTGCRHNNPNLTPAQNAQVNLYATLDVITTANRELARSMVALNAAGTVPDAQTRAVLGYSQQINDGARAALAVLDGSATPAEKTAAVLDALRKIDLPPAVKEFVSSNPNAAAVISIVNSIVSIQRVIVQVASTPPALLDTTKKGAL